MANLTVLKNSRLCAVLKSSMMASTQLSKQYSNQFEPPYLSNLGPQQPVYDLLNICAKSYDYTVVEHYARHVHKTANNLGLNVAQAWATPPREYQINTLKPRSTIVDHNYKLFLYERNVQVSEMPCHMISLLISLIRSSLPEGVELSVHHHVPEEHEEIRYIPDTDLMQLKTQLSELTDPVVKGKKK